MTLFFFTSTMISACGGPPIAQVSDQQELDPAIEANHVNLEGGYAWMTQVAELTDEDIANLNDEVMDVILATGWTRTLRGFERSKRVEPQVVRDIMEIEFMFEVGDREITIAEDGSINMDMIPTANPTVRLFTRKDAKREEYTSPSVEYSVFTDRNGRPGIEITSFRAGPRTQEQVQPPPWRWLCVVGVASLHRLQWPVWELHELLQRLEEVRKFHPQRLRLRLGVVRVLLVRSRGQLLLQRDDA